MTHMTYPTARMRGLAFGLVLAIVPGIEMLSGGSAGLPHLVGAAAGLALAAASLLGPGR